MTVTDHLIYGFLWATFGVLHSVLASDSAKAFTRRVFGVRERLAYNAVAVLHIGGVWIIGMTALGGAAANGFAMQPFFSWLMLACIGLGVVLLVVAFSHYDSGRFTGLARSAADAGPEPLHVNGLHRYVRHPLYSGAFLVLIGQATDPFGLVTCFWASLYLIIGTWFEERRLILLYGDTYRMYQTRVPAFVPWKGRVSG